MTPSEKPVSKAGIRKNISSAVVRKMYENGRKKADIARLLNISVQTVYHHLGAKAKKPKAVAKPKVEKVAAVQAQPVVKEPNYDNKARARALKEQGLKPKDIAKELGITRNTVYQHIKGRIRYNKHSVTDNRVNAVEKAVTFELHVYGTKFYSDRQPESITFVNNKLIIK